MADAMNRSIGNIIVGGFGTGDTAVAALPGAGAGVRAIAADDAAIQLAYAGKVIIVPGYGLAAAQAQHEVAELADVLESHGVDVSYAIHPVAGRMPGHMNVLLAEANVPYPQLKEMDDINPEFARTDVALVIGANDVTNPAARRPGTAISGMPILDVDQAKSIIVIKRSMGHGYAGIDNELYTNPKTSMYFADAKTALAELTAPSRPSSAEPPPPARPRPGWRRVLGHDHQGYWRVAGQADSDRADHAVCDERRAADHDDDGCAGVRSAEVLGRRYQFFWYHALAPLEAPALLAIAQLLGGHCPEFLLDVIEVFFQFAHGTGRQRGHARYMSHVHHLNAAVPALEQVGRGVEGAAGRR